MKKLLIALMLLGCSTYAVDKHPVLRENLKCIADSSGNGKHIDPEYVYNANRVVLYFGASWCGYCKQFYQEKLLPYYDSLGAVVLYVSLDDNKNTTHKYMRKSKMPWNVVMPGTGCVDNMKRLYKTTGGIPELAALDSTDRIISKGNAFESFEKLKSEHSRIIVIDETPDEVLGVVYKVDLLKALTEAVHPEFVKDLMVPVESFNETAKADGLLKYFQNTKLHIAIVRDEFDGVSGVVTLEDVLEIIVGEIVDETDSAPDLREV